MRVDPQHLFDTFGKFNQLSFLGVHQELPLVLDYLKRFAPDCKALESYLVMGRTSSEIEIVRLGGENDLSQMIML